VLVQPLVLAQLLLLVLQLLEQLPPLQLLVQALRQLVLFLLCMGPPQVIVLGRCQTRNL
jgi:hypothetical protein